MLKLLLTSDWRLGRSFQRFEPAAQVALAKARLQAVERLLEEAEKAKVDALVCAGDLFDGPTPAKDVREGALALLRATKVRVVVVPGDRDALVPGSVWRAVAKDAPEHLTVITTDGQVVPLADGATLVAAPCHHHVEALESVERLPRGSGLRVGVAHVSPRASEVPTRDDFAALLLGGSDVFRFGAGDKRTVFPGSPEPMEFGVADSGRAALVTVNDAGKVVVEPRPVARLTWEVVRVDSLAALRRLAGRRDLGALVLRVELRAAVPLADVVAFERELSQLTSNEELMLEVDTAGLSLDTKELGALEAWPAPLQRAAKVLLARSGDPVALKALAQLAELVGQS